MSLVISIFTLVPLLIITLAPFALGQFNLANITTAFMPADWVWDGDHILILLGVFVIGQAYGSAFESVAMYGPDYKKPGSDLPKALFACGAFCLVFFVLIQTSVIGTIGVDGVLAEPISPLVPVANMVFGGIGTVVTVALLILAYIMLLVLLTSATARSLYSLALEGNMPHFLLKTNSKGEPVRCYIVVLVLNFILITTGSPVFVIAGVSTAYLIALTLGLVAYIKSKTDPELKKLDRPFKAPRGFVWVVMGLTIVEVPLLVGALYLNNLSYGVGPTIIGLGLLLLFIPLYLYSRKEFKRRGMEVNKEQTKGGDVEPG